MTWEFKSLYPHHKNIGIDTQKLCRQYLFSLQKYQKLLKLKEHRISQSKAIKLFIKALKEKPLVLDEWDSSCWALFVDKAIVHKDKSITFNFKNGTNIKIEALE